MTYTSGILLGRIIKVKGFEGDVTVKLEKIFTEKIPHLESVFLEIEGRPVPFFISCSEYTGANILKLKFEGYDSIEKLREFTGCRVLLTTNIPEDKQTDDIQSFKEYKIFIEGDKLLGTVSEVIPNPGQWLLNVLSTGNKEILIPFHDHFIVSIDKKKKVIVLDLPEGLPGIK